MILPAMGVVSEVVACFSRKNVFGYSFVAFSSLAIAVFGFLVWAHHMFVAGISVYAAMVFSFLSFAVAIPSAVKSPVNPPTRNRPRKQIAQIIGAFSQIAPL